MFKIEIYEDNNGKSEIFDFIDILKNNPTKENQLVLKKIDSYVDLLEEKGLFLKEPYVKKLDRNIWELRPKNVRIIFTDCFANKFILLSIFKKKTRKTPKKEIAKAKSILKRCLEEG